MLEHFLLGVEDSLACNLVVSINSAERVAGACHLVLLFTAFVFLSYPDIPIHQCIVSRKYFPIVSVDRETSKNHGICTQQNSAKNCQIN